MNKLIKYLLLASFIGTLAETMLVPFFAILTKKVGGDVMDAGVVYGCFCIFTGIVVYYIGKWKKYQENLHIAMLSGFAIAGAADFLFIFCNTIYEIAAVQMLIGISVAILNTSWDAIYTENQIENTSSGEHWSLWNGGISFFEGVGALISGIILFYFNWITLFCIMGLIDAFSIYFAYKVYKLLKKPNYERK